MDLMLIAFGMLFVITIMAFLLGYFPYPFGGLVFGGLFVYRLYHLSHSKKQQR
ncbi:MAG: hypothetical protein V2J55_01995 [Candidatus Competibacteraceae bacterium]|jgi:hypothetical protein|nr:hypothetical protein [Candidatus Competibacteraceae bacterium]